MWKLFRCQWRCFSVFIVNCKHISNVVLTVDFEQAKICSIYIEKANIFEDKIVHIMRYALIWVWTKFINKQHLNIYHHNPMGESLRNFCEGVYLRRWIWLKRCSLHSKWHAVCTLFVFLQVLLARTLIRELNLSCCKLLLSCSITIAKLINQNFFWVLKLPLTALGCYDTDVRLFNFKILNYDGLWENKNSGWKSRLRLNKIDS